jgi:hypothetical protein
LKHVSAPCHFPFTLCDFSCSSHSFLSSVIKKPTSKTAIKPIIKCPNLASSRVNRSVQCNCRIQTINSLSTANIHETSLPTGSYFSATLSNFLHKQIRSRQNNSENCSLPSPLYPEKKTSLFLWKWKSCKFNFAKASTAEWIFTKAEVSGKLFFFSSQSSFLFTFKLLFKSIRIFTRIFTEGWVDKGAGETFFSPASSSLRFLQ